MLLQKVYVSIGQVSEYADLPQSVLRYWETVFERLKPRKSAGGTRQYSEEDIAMILKIKELLYKHGYTIKGANTVINSEFPASVMTNSSRISKTPIKIKGLNKEKTSAKMSSPPKVVTVPVDYSEITARLKAMINILEK